MSMDYKLKETELKLNFLADKMGSDYFPRPLFLEFFRTATWDFVNDRLSHIEQTQQITDDIRPLVVTRNLVAIPDPNFAEFQIVPIPTDYHRTVAHDIYYKDNTKCRRSDMKTQSEYRVSLNDPNNKPTKLYPIILQEAGVYKINSGNTAIKHLRLIYAKKPSFAEVSQNDTRVVNLPDDAIEKILWTTVLYLFNKTADQRTQSTNALEKSFRKTFA